MHGANREDFNFDILENCGAQETRQTVEDTLKRVQLDFEKRIVDTTNDGPRVMKKFRRGSPSEMNIFLNHARYLGVVDTIEKRKFTLLMQKRVAMTTMKQSHYNQLMK